MRDKFFLILGVAIIAWSFYAFFTSPPAKGEIREGVIVIANTEIQVEIADSDLERMRGLSGGEALAARTGLLFIFEKSGLHGFWMKDMNFPIDIVWLDENFGIIGVEKSVSPDTYPQVFYPPRAVKYVLELNAGESDVLESK